MTDPAALRQTYDHGTLHETDVGTAWYPLLHEWFEAAAQDPQVLEPNAIQLATVDEAGIPAVRTVLAKGIDADGIVFYTNYDSAKGRALIANPRAAIVFVWLAQQRQVRLSGVVAKVSREETQRYFASRPRESQLGAWASPQSQVVGSRGELDERLTEVTARFADSDIDAPPDWGGFRLVPEAVEFWQGRVGRLHDRIRLRRSGETWLRERLAP